ncbi:MAG TPA: hypothetical protein VFV38_50360 [Ktedonobacteraceae bacterium]|nr:hypothetical protein [Ktedonobacteraceae bacterium]
MPNASRCKGTLLAQMLPRLSSLLRSFPVRNVPIRVWPGSTALLAMRIPNRLDG